MPCSGGGKDWVYPAAMLKELKELQWDHTIKQMLFNVHTPILPCHLFRLQPIDLSLHVHCTNATSYHAIAFLPTAIRVAGDPDHLDDCVWRPIAIQFLALFNRAPQD